MKYKFFFKNNKLLFNMYMFIRKILAMVSPTLNTKVTYFISKGKKINLDNPRTLDEKISWLKINVYSKDPLVIKCADKIRVRDYIKEIGVGEILNELYGIYNNTSEIKIPSLPDKFALKWNTGSGGNYICTDKKSANLAAEFNKLELWKEKWNKKKPYLYNAETHYQNIKPMLLCEKYLGDNNSLAPLDYKFYCFNGKAEIVMLCLGRDKGHPKFYFFDREWNFLRINNDGIEAPKDFNISKPNFMNDMFDYADKVSHPFPFVRADFYEYKEKIIFGELTFTPAGGIDSNLPSETDLMLGEMINLPL